MNFRIATALCALLLPGAAVADVSGWDKSCMNPASKDRLTLDRSEDSGWCFVVTYWNSDRQCSDSLSQPLYHDGFVVDAQILVNQSDPGTDAELIIITPPPGYFTEPNYALEVPDGEEAKILICPGVS